MSVICASDEPVMSFFWWQRLIWRCCCMMTIQHFFWAFYSDADMLSLEYFVYCFQGRHWSNFYICYPYRTFLKYICIYYACCYKFVMFSNFWFFCTGIKENLQWPCVGDNSCMSVSVDILVCQSWAYLFVCLMWMYDSDRDDDYDDAVELCDRYERWTPWQEVHHDLPRLLLSSANRSQQFRQRELYSQQNCKLMKMYCLPAVSSDADSWSDCQLVQTVAWQPGSSE